KYLLASLSSGDTLIVHLGMSGSFRIDAPGSGAHASGDADRHDHVVFQLSSEFDAAALARACRGKKISLKLALLDQRVVAGLGNIYASEALHVARLSPDRQASTVATRSGAPREPARRLAAAIKRVLEDAIARLSKRTYREAPFLVYGRSGERCSKSGC